MARGPDASGRTAPRARGAGLAGAFALVAVLAAAAGAQPGAAAPPEAADTADAEEPPRTLPDGTRRVRGRVVTPRDSALAPVPGAWVTLHRVGRDAAGPLDSVRTDAQGGYAITYRPRGDARAVYFVATSRGGVAYFTPPLTAPAVEGEAAEVTVYDTTSSRARLMTSGRHLIVSRPGAGATRDVLEVFELSNGSAFTIVPPAEGGEGGWSVPVPAGARDFAVRASADLSADGLALVGGRARLLVPVGPGLKQVAFSYRLPESAFPLRLPLDPGTGVVEVLVEDPSAAATGAGLAPVGPVVLEGKSFRRFVSQNASAGGTIEVTAAGAVAQPWSRYTVPALLGVVGGTMAVALVLTGRRRAPSQTARPGAAAAVRAGAAWSAPLAPAAADDDADRLLAELAALDDAQAAEPATNAAERAAYAERRAEIKARLASALADRPLAGAPNGR